MKTQSSPIREQAAPVPPAERVVLLDALRGFALLGILTMNLLAFSGYYELKMVGQLASLPTPATDRISHFLMAVFAEGKFYSLFSLLFGIGFAMQMLRAEQKGDDFVLRYRRRLGVLVVIGMVHLCVVWAGDILVLYALLGFLLLPLRRYGDRALLIGAAALIAAPVLLRAVVLASGGVLDPGAPVLALGERLDAGLFGAEAATPLVSFVVPGGWIELAKYNLAGPVWRFGELLQEGRAFKVLGMFLIGFVAARRAIFSNLEANHRLLRRVLIAGLALGVVGNLLFAWLTVAVHAEFLSLLGLAETAAYAVGVAPLALAYGAGFALLWTRPGWRRWLMLPAPAGRMALTNYLAQSFVGIGLFYGVGLGRGGHFGPTLIAPLAVLVFAAQLQLSALWLRRYRYGPAEWLWRSLTYGQRQPCGCAPRWCPPPRRSLRPPWKGSDESTGVLAALVPAASAHSAGRPGASRETDPLCSVWHDRRVLARRDADRGHRLRHCARR